MFRGGWVCSPVAEMGREEQAGPGLCTAGPPSLVRSGLVSWNLQEHWARSRLLSSVQLGAELSFSVRICTVQETRWYLMCCPHGWLWAFLAALLAVNSFRAFLEATHTTGLKARAALFSLSCRFMEVMVWSLMLVLSVKGVLLGWRKCLYCPHGVRE